MSKGVVFDIKKYALHDGPGIRTTIFLKGCPLRCLWCHNPEGQKVGQELMLRPGRCLPTCTRCVQSCPQKAISKPESIPLISSSLCDCCGLCAEVCPSEALEMVGRVMSAEEVMAEVMKDRPFYQESGGGVTFSGGEPLLQPDFLEELLRLAKNAGLHTVVDTSGQAQMELFRRLLPLVDLFLYDLKHMNSARHRELTGQGNELILGNLKELARLTPKIIIRIPVIPQVNDDEENLRQTAAFIKSLPRLQGVELLPYHNLGKDKYLRLGREYKLKELAKPSPEQMERIAQVFRQAEINVSLGG